MIKNIVYVYDKAHISGGAAKIAMGEALEMKRRGFRVIFFAAIGPIGPELTEAGIEVICLDEKNITLTKDPKALLKGLYNRNSYTQLKKLLVTLSPQETAVHVHGWVNALSSSIFCASSEVGIKTFVTLHEYFTICPNGGLYNYQEHCICSKRPGSLQCALWGCDKRSFVHKMYRNVRQAIQNNVLKKARPIPIYITDFSKEIISPHYPYPVNSRRVDNHVEISGAEKRIEAEKNQEYLFIGRLSEEKGLDLFCEAMARLNKKACVIGDGRLLEAYKQKYPQIDFVGWKTFSEMKAYIDKARCLVVSSRWYETMGLTIIEMQQYGIPCIVPKQCAGSEYVVHNETGLLYTIGNVDSLVEAVRLSEDDALVKTMSYNFHAGLDTERFSLESHCDTLVKLYQEELLN